ncbi:MAG TPA: LysM domain-containing protein, partial [Candidatus Polarisedimenticolaceae bacterium]|nr:LysM domain-containing protein [Candidatus Polarisedimenticolaceae bacterium]
ASSLAKRFYGDYELAGLLLEYNGRRGSTVIHVDEQLAIPICPEHRVRAGDTWSVLAARHLGRPDGWAAVALLNEMLPEKPLAIGSTIVFPVVMPYELRRGESLAALARRFYGDSDRAEVLQRWNGIDDPRRLAVGASVEIPLVAFRATASGSRPASAAPASSAGAPAPDVATGVEPPAPEPPAPEPPPGLTFGEPLDDIAAALDEGRYDDARERIDALLDRVQAKGTLEAQARMWELVGRMRVAFDDYERACEAYRALAALASTPDLDADRVSPKIRSVYRDCVAASR